MVVQIHHLPILKTLSPNSGISASAQGATRVQILPECIKLRSLALGVGSRQAHSLEHWVRIPEAPFPIDLLVSWRRSIIHSHGRLPSYVQAR